MVWYAAYGSNCLESRLLAYLTGTRAARSSVTETGTSNPSPPAASAPCQLPHRVRFAGESRKWGGAVAFLEHRTSPRPSLGRRYLLTWGQFDELVAQESRRPPIELPIADLRPGVHQWVGDRGYDCLLALEPVDGVPVVTFTSPSPPEERTPGPPSAAYLGTIARGLAQSHRVPTHEIAEHLLQAVGVHPQWTRETILALFDPGHD